MAKRRNRDTILIIEDRAEVRNFAARVCELEGYRVLLTDDGDTGLKLARENPVALVLLDLRLSGQDGWSVLEEIKGSPELSALPVVVFTASAGVTQRDRAISMGAADYLVKPVSVSRLKKTLARILRKKR